MHKIITRNGKTCDAINLRGMTDPKSVLIIEDRKIYEIFEDEQNETPVATLVSDRDKFYSFHDLAKESKRTVIHKVVYSRATSYGDKGLLSIYSLDGTMQTMAIK